MKLAARATLDKIFTGMTGLSVVLLALVLIAVLGPMVYRGSSAVVFNGTVEFRKMQRDLFNRADRERLEVEIAETEKFRAEVYQKIDVFKKGIDIEAMSDRVRQINRDFGKELRYKDTPAAQYTELRGRSRKIRDTLEDTFGSQDIATIQANIAEVLQFAEDPNFQDTCVEEFFSIARGFLAAASQVDLSRHHEYVAALEEVELILFGSNEHNGLLGPRPEEPIRAMARVRYGATRRDQARQLLDRFLVAEEWVATEGRDSLVKVRTSRAEQFKGTSLEPLFGHVQANLDKLLAPRFTIYWQFFIDDNVNSHYFGGVGPE